MRMNSNWGALGLGTWILWLALGTLSPAQSLEELHTTPQDIPVVALDAREAFMGLTEREKLYAHHMSEASWWGALITFEQLSPESPGLLELILRLYDGSEVALRREATRLGLTDEDIRDLDTYAARVLSNCGNYLSFGDTKFIPRISKDKFARLVFSRARSTTGGERLVELWSGISDAIYSLDESVLSLGTGDQGVSAYYSDNVEQSDIDAAASFMKSLGMEAWNTRLTREADDSLHILVASALKQPSREFTHEGRRFVIEYGDHAEILQRVVRSLSAALPYAANDNQRRMILAYINHFNGGDINAHKESQKHWILDTGPVVETNIGFIETYRDPQSVRAEWEGFVAVVNKEQTKKFAALVNAAADLIPLLPWGRDFEKETFRKPDFTSLEVLTFASSGIPLGINIPNYNEIRQNFGFKNVSLGNVARARGKGGEGPISFLVEEDQDLYRRLADHAFEVQVGLHELLGHGSGKLLRETAPGKFNFDREHVVSTVDGRPVTSWYKPGETWGSKFTTIASSYEECRAETVGLHLCTNDRVLKVFGYEGKEAEDIAYINWLSMARSGIAALTFYDPKKDKWGQAHMQARFAILQIMLRAGKGFLRVAQDGEGHWRLHMDRSRISTVGRKAVADFLTRLNVYKATGDVEHGRALYLDLTRVNDRFKKIRAYVLSQRKPRHVWVQPVTDIDASGHVILREYEETPRGVIRSFLDRYAGLF